MVEEIYLHILINSRQRALGKHQTQSKNMNLVLVSSALLIFSFFLRSILK